MMLLNDPKTKSAKKNTMLGDGVSKHFSRAERHETRRKNNALFAGTAVAAFFVTSSLVVNFRQAHNHPAAPHLAPLMVPMTVGQGQTFWSFAQKYGDTNDYILDRVSAVAQANGMSTHAALVPGQRILVPVSDPQQVALLQTHLAKR